MFEISKKTTMREHKPKENRPKKNRPNEMDLIVSTNLKNKRIMTGLTLQNIAEAVDVTTQQVQKYESGVNRISAGKLYQISNFLQVPLEYFFNYECINQGKKVEHAYKNSNEKEVTSLLKQFTKIENPLVRKKVVEIIKLVK